MNAKYRGKSIETGEWFFGYYIHFLGNDFISRFENNTSKDFAECFVSVHPKSVGQFTGLKDKNSKGKKAYHHDVIRICVRASWNENEPITITGEIVWENCGWWFRGKETNEWNCHLSDLPPFEIIGNLTDDPNLLEK